MKNVVEINVNRIQANPFQPRRQFADEDLQELKKSIQHYGVLQPLLVVAAQYGNYILVAGERRLRAAKLAGLLTVPCVVGDYDNKQKAEIALIENIQRANLNYMEEAVAIQRLLQEFGITQEELGQHLGKSQATIANKLRLLRLDEKLQQELLDAGLTERHARALLKVEERQRPKVLKHIVQGHMNVQQTDKYVEKLLQPNVPVKRKLIVSNVKIYLNSFRKIVDTMKQGGIDTDYQHTVEGKDLVITIKVKDAVKE